MTKFFIAAVLLLFFFTGCSTIQVNQDEHRLTTKKIVLADIGVGNELLFENTYKNTAILNLSQPIKIAAIPVTFTKKKYTAFLKALPKQPVNLEIQYIDSLKKPKFLHFKIIDQVALIEELNGKKNRNIKNYLRIKPDARIVTGISMAMEPQTIVSILKADAIFLENTGTKTYLLQLYIDNKFVQSIHFDEGVVFAYKTASFCWKENDRRELQIVALSDNHNNCPDNTYKRSKRADKKINYFKL